MKNNPESITPNLEAITTARSRSIGLAWNFKFGISLALVVWCLVLGVSAAPAAGADWPQYRGASHDGSTVEKISLKWPGTGLRQIWKQPTNNGFSSFAVAAGKAFTQVTREIEGAEREVVIALDSNTGKELWATPVGMAKYGHDGGNSGAPNNKGGDGPRSTPTVDGGKVYVLTSDLLLVCLDAQSGKQAWSRDLIKEHQGRNISWKNAASPLLDGDRIFVAGGGAGQSLLAIDKKDGNVIWKAQDETITHSTPVAATILGVRQVIFFCKSGLVAVDAKDGALLWKQSFPFNVSTAMTPIVAGDIVFCSAGYNVGAGAYRISKNGNTFTSTELWRTNGNQPVANHWSTPVYHDGHLYGMFQFKEYGGGPLKCVELSTGQVKWSQPGFGAGNVIRVGDHILALSDAGQIVLLKATPTAYTEVGRMIALDGKCWSTPVLANGHIYARSTKEAVCLDISGK